MYAAVGRIRKSLLEDKMMTYLECGALWGIRGSVPELSLRTFRFRECCKTHGSPDFSLEERRIEYEEHKQRYG